MAGPLGAAPGIVVGVGVGTAAAAGLDPVFEPGKQAAWLAHPNKVLDPGLLAQLVAKGGIDLGTGQSQALRSGLSADRLDQLVYLSQTAPDVAIALELWRRGKLTEAQVDHALVKAGLEFQYWGPLKELFVERLGAPVIALAIVRGIMRNPGFLPVGPPTTEGNVKAFPVSPLDPIAEAQAVGVDSDRLFIETAIAGRPAAPDLAARGVFRGILERVDYDRAIAEGDIRNEWADAIFEASRQILSAHDYAELQLRGFQTAEQRDAGAAKHGMTAADAELLYNMLGRSISVHQVVTGEARGGTFDGPTAGIPPARLQSMQRSNIRPEYFNLADANRYSYPSAFFFRILLTSGEITADQGYQRFLEIGWPPDLAREIADALAPAGGTGKADPYVVKADNQLWTALHKAFVKQGVDRPTVESAMTVLVTDAADREIIFERWATEAGLGSRTGPPA